MLRAAFFIAALLCCSAAFELTFVPPSADGWEAAAKAADLGEVWSFCGTANDKLKIGKVIILPDPPKKGQNLTVVATGVLNEELSAGTITISLKYGIIPVLKNKQIDLCTASKSVTCPFKQGPLTLGTNATVPAAAPSGKYTGKVTVTDQNGAQVTCIALDFRL